ncbi:FAD-binding protein [Anaerocolumna xylanovorans]|uniref:Dehydrogenase (Flavoprotein) n=1 Tax=Anaerocolumna xylanovorans DSM 12503 TaxID=1121345 RepID=A0A1M7Y6Y7_9FIRM|nr:FAD-binding protein [Anaerocolumna xylanovorans]SHO48370.1 Dehydrogenase (flavoprotein) [Anaerocolumna xylanovorans DSM 12503]
MYDIVIAGAGPAGANLARLLGNRYKVLLIDKRDLENENPKNQSNKCCGGLLAPDAQKMIAKLGLGIPKDILVDPQLFAVRTIDLTNHLERLYQRFYFNIDREKFDRWLVSLLPSDVDKKFNAVFKAFAKIPGGYEIQYTCNGQELYAKTKVLVGADGAASRVRTLIGKNIAVPEKYIAVQEWFECPYEIPYYTAIFDEEISDFYSWMIPKENCLLLGAALRPRENTKEKYELLKSKLTKLGFDFNHKIKTEGAFINRTRKLSQFYTGQDGIALVGEAAGAISPSSAEGISYALKSSFCLAQSLETGIDGFLDRYKQKTADIRLNLLLKNLKSPAMYNPFLRQLAMKSGLQSIK